MIFNVVYLLIGSVIIRRIAAVIAAAIYFIYGGSLDLLFLKVSSTLKFNHENYVF